MMAKGPISLVIAAIAAVYLAWKHWDVIEVIVGRVFSVVKTWLVDKFGGMVVFVKDALTRVIGFYVRLYGPIFTAVRKVYSAIKTWLVDYLMAAVEQIKGAVAAVVGFFRRAKQEADTRRMREEVKAAADRFTEIGKEAKAVEDRLRGFGKRIKLNPAAFREMSARAAEMRAEVDRLGTGAPASLKRLEAALDTARKEMGLTAQSASTYTEALAKVHEEVAGITEAMGTEIRAEQKLGVSLEDLSKKFGISTEALKLYLDSLDEADTQVGELSDAVQTLVDRLRGTDTIQAAHDWAAALEQVGGLTTLTDDETTQLVGTLETAITKWRALGEAVPTEIYQRFIEATTRLRQVPLADLGLIGTRLDPEQFFKPLQQLTLSEIGPIGIPLEPEITPRFRTKIESAFTGFGAEIGQTFARALEGGGQWLGAIQSLGVQAGDRLGTFLSKGLGKRLTEETSVFSKGIGNFFGKAMGQAIPVIGPLIGAGIGKLFGAFTKPSEAELAARQQVADYQHTIIEGLSSSQLAEAAAAARGAWAGDEQGAQFVIGVRDAYVAAGRSAAAAIVARYWAASKDGGPEAVAALEAQIEAVVQVGREQQQRLAELGALKEAGQAAFNSAQIEPYIEKLLETGTITQQQASQLRGLADEAHVDYQTMQQAAEKYGVELSALGPAFDQARISEAAAVIVKDFELLTQEGANVNGVLRGMQDEVQDLVSDALTAGVAIPEGMRPIIESLIEQGRLTDENGEKLTDVSQLTFAEPLAAKFDTLIEKLTALIEKITGRGGITEAIAGIPRDVDVGVDVRYREHGRPDDFGEMEIAFAQHGTPFRHFGRGTPAVLHGLERVMTGMEGRGIAAALGRIQQGLGAIADLSGVRALAEGGLVTRPTLALLGERGTEAVIPHHALAEAGGRAAADRQALDRQLDELRELRRVLKRQEADLPFRLGRVVRDAVVEGR